MPLYYSSNPILQGGYILLVFFFRGFVKKKDHTSKIDASISIEHLEGYVYGKPQIFSHTYIKGILLKIDDYM